MIELRRNVFTPQALALALLGAAVAGEALFLAYLGVHRSHAVWPAIAGLFVLMAALGAAAWRIVVVPLERRHLQSREQLRSLFEDNPEAVVTYDLQGRVVTANAAALLMWAGPERALRESTFAGRVVLERRSDAFKAFARSAAGDPTEFETTLERFDGKRIDIAASLIPSIVDGRIDGVYSISRDVTQERSAERELHEQAHRIRELYIVAATAGQSAEDQIQRALELGCERLDLEWGFVANVEHGVARMRASAGVGPYGVGQGVKIEKSIIRRAMTTKDLVVIEDADNDPVAAEPEARSGKLTAFVTFPIEVDGRSVGAVGFASRRPRTSPISSSDRDFVRLIGALIGGAIERGESKHRLDRMAFSDPLTGLPNRASLNASIEDLIDRANRGEDHFAVHFIDLDGFKMVNDERGHAAGDELLRIVAQRIRATIAPVDIVARLGGDEFIVLSQENRAREAGELASRVIDAISEPVLIDGARISIGASIGIACYPEDGSDVKTLFGKADHALYRAKSSGRGCFDCATLKAS